MKEITSPTNPQIKEVVKLRKRSHRDETGLVIVEGYTEFRRAVDAGVKIKELYVCPEIFDYIPEDYPQDVTDVVINVPKEVFKKIAFGERLKGVLAVCHQPKYSIDDLDLPPNPHIVVMEGVEKPGNLGAVLRTADGAGIDALIMCDGRTDIFNHNVVRSSIGTVFTVPTVAATKEQTLEFIRKAGVKSFAATAHTDEFYLQSDFTRGCVLLLGNEHEGLSEFWLENADEKVKIPMNGAATCLNVAASAAILIYEAYRQKQLGL